jgi:cytidyltransferase-like protein
MFETDFYDDLGSLQPIVVVSGGFDPLHSGHLAMFERASRAGRLLVVLNSDDWLTRKKGKPFMPYSERAAIVSALKTVQGVTHVDDADGTVCEALRRIKAHFTYPKWSPPIFFCNGGDRGVSNTPEIEVCAELGIDCLYGVGGDKTQSSSDFLAEWMAFADQPDDACVKVKVCIGEKLSPKHREQLLNTDDEVAEQIVASEPHEYAVDNRGFKCGRCGSYGPLSKPCGCLDVA